LARGGKKVSEDFVIVIDQIPKKYEKYVPALRKAYSHDGDKGYDGKINSDYEKVKAAELICQGSPRYKKEEVAKAEACLKKTLGIEEKKSTVEAKGIDLVGNPKFNLVEGKIYGQEDDGKQEPGNSIGEGRGQDAERGRRPVCDSGRPDRGLAAAVPGAGRGIHGICLPCRGHHRG
jgi:hypothetical protein